MRVAFGSIAASGLKHLNGRTQSGSVFGARPRQELVWLTAYLREAVGWRRMASSG